MGPNDTLRTALLILGEPALGAGGNRRMIGGTTLIERQVDVALALGCRRIWLAASQLDRVAIRAQQLAEQGGAQFRLIQRCRNLLGGLRQQDELVVLAEGLLPADQSALERLNAGPVILRLAAGSSLAAGFERLDRDFCWAGAMVLPGRVVERLEGLDDGIDPVSALLRAGRAARVPERTLPEEWLTSGRWRLDPDRIPLTVASEPGDRIAPLEAFVARPAGVWLAERPRLALAIGIGGGATLVAAAAVLSWSGPAAALLGAALAAVLLACWNAARRAGDPRVFSGSGGGAAETVAAYLPVPLGSVALVLGLGSQFDWRSTAYIAFFTLLTWFLAALGRHRSAGLFREHAWLWLICGLAGAAGHWIAGAVLANMLSLAGMVLTMRKQPAITPA